MQLSLRHLMLTYFRSFFGGNQRHQKTILKLSDLYTGALGHLKLQNSVNVPVVECPLIGPQIREQMPGPDLHVFKLKFLALK